MKYVRENSRDDEQAKSTLDAMKEDINNIQHPFLYVCRLWKHSTPLNLDFRASNKAFLDKLFVKQETEG